MKSLIEEIGGCEVTVRFADQGDPDVMKQILFLLMEGYEERIAEEMEQKNSQ